ncbi:MAG: coenzyme F420-0:L-glutamate ligase [Nitrospirae bacterium]|nr:coenzyme F420-0:L-glutamate ligase [Nitrospirota bacterium]
MKPGGDLGEIISRAAQREIGSLEDKDIAIVTMKIVSTAEHCLMQLDKVSPSEKAKRIAGKTGKPVRLVQAILDHSEEIIGVIPFYKLIKEGIIDLRSFSRRPEQALELIRRDPTFLITQDKRGEVYSDAGVDTSNHPEGIASYPPLDPDRSARDIRQSIRNHTDKDIAVIIADTELFLSGTIDMPRGISGIPLRMKRFGEGDLFNRPKYGGVDLIAFELTAAASLLFGQTNEGVPVVIVRGYEYEVTDQVSDQSLNLSSAKKSLKEIVMASIRLRISEYLDNFRHPLRKD